MKSEKFEVLIKKYPEMFGYLNTKKGEPFHPICFGCECSSGWDNLVETTLETIYSYCKDNKKPFPQITQIKEKWGGLQIYIDGGDDMVFGMIWMAEAISYKICEKCGTMENVTTNEDGWVSTLCDKCRTK